MQRDPAFQWESQALRESMLRRDGSAVPDDVPAPPAPVRPSGSPPAPPAQEPVPEGTMLIPIAAWDKLLMQLGNLHEAGQQLAEARERAGKAETEAMFLRERLSDLRDQLAEARGEPSTPDPPPVEDSGDDSEPERLWRYVFGRWQHRRSR